VTEIGRTPGGEASGDWALEGEPKVFDVERAPGKWRLSSGRSIELDGLRQWRQGGPLEGAPTAEINEESIRDVVARFGAGEGTYLVPPKQRPLPSPRPRSPSPRTHMILPAIVVVGEFVSLSPVGGVNESGWDQSRLTVIWYQDHWALPIDDDVFEHILEIDWDSSARNVVMPY
jgi:hypothetical protein